MMACLLEYCLYLLSVEGEKRHQCLLKLSHTEKFQLTWLTLISDHSISSTIRDVQILERK